MFGARLPDGGAGSLDGGRQLGLRPRIDERRGRRSQARDNGLAADDGIARLELDALDAPHDRRRDDEPLAHPRLTLLVNRDLHRATSDLRGIDFHGARPQRHGQDDGHDRDGRDEPRVLEHGHGQHVQAVTPAPSTLPRGRAYPACRLTSSAEMNAAPMIPRKDQATACRET